MRHVRGTESTKRSIQKLKKRKAEEAGNRTTSIILAISLSGVQFLDPINQVRVHIDRKRPVVVFPRGGTRVAGRSGYTRAIALPSRPVPLIWFRVCFLSAPQETICKHEIRNINWACQDADDLTHFAYITKDQESSQDHFCHVFQVNSMVSGAPPIYCVVQPFVSHRSLSCLVWHQDLATEVILTLGQAFEVAYQLVLRQEIYSPTCNGDSSQLIPTNATPLCVVPLSPAPTVAPVVPAAEPVVGAAANNNKKPVIAAKPLVLDPGRKIGPKPTVLPPKPKLGTTLFNQQRPGSGGSNSISHARSHSSVDGVPASSGAASAMVETRLLSESNLASLQARPVTNAPASMISAPSTASVSSTGSGRAPLAAKDELWRNKREKKDDVTVWNCRRKKKKRVLQSFYISSCPVFPHSSSFKSSVVCFILFVCIPLFFCFESPQPVCVCVNQMFW